MSQMGPSIDVTAFEILRSRRATRIDHCRMARISSRTRDAAAFLKHPESLDDFLVFRLWNLSRLAGHSVGLMLHREAGMSRRDLRVVAYVSKQPGVSLTQLAQIAGIDTVVTSRCVASLVARGLIAKTWLGSNKRLVALMLTDFGRAVYERARSCGQKYNIDFAGASAMRRLGNSTHC